MSMLEQGYSARYIIFNKLFSVKVRNVESLSKEYILTYELPYTGDKKTEVEGVVQQTVAKGKELVEDAKDAVEGAVEGIKDALK